MHSDSVAAAQMDLDAVQNQAAAPKVESVAAQKAVAPEPVQSAMSSTATTTEPVESADTKSNEVEPVALDAVDQDDAAESVLSQLNKGRTIYSVSQSVKDCGNVFVGSRIFFEYVIDKEKKKQFQSLKALPFQVRIS